MPAAQLLPSLAATSDKGAAPGELLLLGGVDYNRDEAPAPGPRTPDDLRRLAVRGSEDMTFDALPGTLEEIAGIEKLYSARFGEQGVKTLAAKQAGEDALRQSVAGREYLHLATHGFFAPPSVQSALQKSIAQPSAAGELASIAILSAAVAAAPAAAQAPASAASKPAAQASKMAGIGAVLRAVEDGVLVEEILPDGAALADGRLKVDDLVVALAEASGEFNSIAGKQLPDVVSLIRGPTGSKIRLKVRPAGKSAEVVYELAHGVINDANFANKNKIGEQPGLLSGIALAGANHPQPNGDDGILTAEEVATLDLTGCKLAVLSACETGLGEAAGGEGLLGLQRSFQIAGARTVIASLWKVPDAATRNMMQRFYNNLWNKKLGKLEALREAQIWMIRHGGEQVGIRREIAARGAKSLEKIEVNSQHLPPYYWAAFVLSGDWR